MAEPREVRSDQTLDDELLPDTGEGTVVEGSGDVRGPGHATLPASPPTQESGGVKPPPPPPSSTRMMTVARASYEFGAEVARGGLGRILKARDLRLNRDVAIKELLRPTASSEARFLREIQATVRLQHPNIVAVHEAGRWPDGRLFYAMNFVAGKTLLDVIEEPPNDSRLELLPTILDVAEAIAFAHSEGFVHRDLKPANVLVGRFGETVVIDWGLAKFVGRPERELPSPEPLGLDHGVTRTGSIVGTPPYMPPEQASGREVDQRSDVYALGAILYHALSGRPPYFDVKSEQLLEQIRRGPPRPLGELESSLPPDLLAIVDKAMARDPHDRYPSGAEMLRELREFTRGRLVAAYTYRTRDLLERFVRRNLAAVITALVATLVLLIAAAIGVGEIREERDLARQSEQTAKESERVAKEQLALAETRARSLIVTQALALTETDPTLAVASLKQLRQPTRRAASVAARAEEYGVSRRILRGHTDSVNCLDISPDGSQIISGGDDHRLMLWSLDGSGAQPLLHHADRVTDCTFSPNGVWLASGSYDGQVTLWPLARLTPKSLLIGRGAVKALSFSSDGQYLAAASEKHRIDLWRLSDGTHSEHPVPIARSPFLEFRAPHRFSSGPHAGKSRLWTVDGSYLESPDLDVTVAQTWDDPLSMVLGSNTGDVFEWNARLGATRRIASLGAPVTALSTSTREPGYAAAATMQGDVMQIDLVTQRSRRLLRHEERVLALQVSPHQRFVASGGWDRQVQVFDLATDDGRKLRGHTDVISDLAFTPDERHLVTASWDKTLRVWQLRDELHDLRSVLMGHDDGVESVRFSPDGKWLASGGRDHTVRLWNLGDKTHRVLRGHTDHVHRVIFSPDGAWLASSSSDGTVRVWSTRDTLGHQVLRGHEGKVDALAYSPDGRWLVSASEDTTARVWDTLGRSAAVLYHDQTVTQVVFNPRGTLLATGSRAGDVRLFDMDTRRELAVYTDHPSEVFAVAFSPDGQWLASADKSGRTILRHLAEGRNVRWSELPGAHGLVFSPDGNWLAVSGATPHLWLCRVAISSCYELRAHESIVRGMRFSPDSTLLISAGGDGDTLLWDVETREYRVYRGHRAPIFDLDVSPDGAWIATASGDATVRLWPRIPVPKAEELTATLNELTRETVPDIVDELQP